jgi:hypothetical protein
MRDLCGASEERVGGRSQAVLRLPDPLGPDEPERRSNEVLIWNPKWLVVKPLTDEYNKRFIDVVVSTIIANEKVSAI